MGIGQKRREIVAKRVETCEKRGRTAETEENGNTTDDKDENGRNVPDVRFTAVTVGIGQKLRENVAKRVESGEKRGRTAVTEVNGNTTDENGRTWPGCPVHGRHGGHRAETSGNRGQTGGNV